MMLFNTDRYEKVKSFIRTNMPSARFIENPYHYNDGSWSFYISYEIEDINKIGWLLKQFDDEDNKIKTSNDNFFVKLYNKIFG